MAVDDFLSTYKNTMLNKKMVNPLSSSNTSMTNPQLGIRNQSRGVVSTPGFGQQVPDWLDSRKSSALDAYMQSKSESTSDLASKYADKAAGQVSVNEFGIVQDKMSNFSDFFNKQLSAVGAKGKAHLATVEAQAEHQRLQNLQEQSAGYNINWSGATAGASGSNPGAKAVQLALKAQGTPYVFGGNSLTGGVDCSGLVQQVYKKMGINLPRTTYEQAKAGKVVSIGALLPGDLVFYNTGSRDPNGIGKLSHVAIYMGNGKIIEAPRKGIPVRVSTLTGGGQPARAVRPW